MSSQRSPRASSCLRCTPDGKIVPMYACGGVRPINTGVAVFPLGGVEEGQTCPARDICAWFAGFDFGGENEFIDQPESSILDPQFRVGPFSCDRFFAHASLLQAKKHVLRSPHPVAGVPMFRILPDLVAGESLTATQAAGQG